jgi:hypothetical protein
MTAEDENFWIGTSIFERASRYNTRSTYAVGIYVEERNHYLSREKVGFIPYGFDVLLETIGWKKGSSDGLRSFVGDEDCQSRDKVRNIKISAMVGFH